MSLFEALQSAEITDEKDLENHKETLRRILEKPYAVALYRENVEGKKFNLKKLHKKDLIAAMETASYIGVPAKRLLDKYLWKLSAKTFKKFFKIDGCLCEPKDTIPRIVKMELIIAYGKPPYSRAKLSYKRSPMHEASAEGNLKLLKRFVKNRGVLTNDVTMTAAAHGHLDCLKFAHENGAGLTGCENAKNVECLRYLHEHEADWDELTTAEAAARGDLESLKYAHENGCPWASNTLGNAASSGHLDCLKYAYENGCEWDEDEAEGTIWWEAVSGGNMDCLEYLYGKYPADPFACSIAADNKNLKVLEFLHEKGFEWDNEFCADIYYNAISSKNFKILKYLVRNGTPDPYIVILAAKEKNIEALVVLYREGYKIPRQYYNDYISKPTFEEFLEMVEKSNE